MTLTFQHTPSVSLADTLDVVDAVLAALDRRLPAHVSRDDLASAGKLALIEALLRFNGPPEQARAYCFVRVRGAVFDELRRLDPLSRHTRAQVTLVRRATEALERQLGRAPVASEIAAATGLSGANLEQLERLAAVAQPCSTDETDVEGEPLHAVIDNDAVCPARSAETLDTYASLHAALDQLPPNHARVLRRYYLEDATLDDIAEELGISKERVRQIREAAEKKLREEFVVLALWRSSSAGSRSLHPITQLSRTHPPSCPISFCGALRCRSVLFAFLPSFVRSMKPLFQSKPAPLTSAHGFTTLFNVEIPVPALQRRWLHGREFTQAWDVDRIAAKIGSACWFSHYTRDNREDDPDATVFELHALAGFWPDGGFLELQMHRGNLLDEHPRGTLGIYTDSPDRTEAIMADLLANYRFDDSASAPLPRVGMLNFAYGRLNVERIPVTPQQTVPRERLNLYYRQGMTAWTEAWLETLNTRRYGLTVLTGPPGTGKTTLLRSLAQWLVDTHVFYFMPAARFAAVESGEIVAFWVNENRTAKLKKVLILEDAESVLLRRADDNREKVGTLLNLTDGMLGDALGLHVVCTLNSELADLDPALLRPGRLVAHRDFELLTVDEARQLAEFLGVPVPRGDRVSLAEFFNRANAPTFSRPSPPRRSMGFHAALQQS